MDRRDEDLEFQTVGGDRRLERDDAAGLVVAEDLGDDPREGEIEPEGEPEGEGDPALDLSEFDVAGHPSRNQKLFVYAGRDLYRPGETFTVSVLARDAAQK